MGVVKITFKQLCSKKYSRFQHYCKFYRAISVMDNEIFNVNLFNEFAALIYLNLLCEDKEIRPFLYVWAPRLSSFSFVNRQIF